MSDLVRFTYRADCGCTLSGQINAAGEFVNTGGILRCPLHEATLSLMAACEYALQFIEEYDPDLTLHPSLRNKLRAALVLARPTPTEKGR